MDHRRVRGLVRSDGVILDRLTRAVFHQRNMLMRCRMIDNLRMILFKHLKNLAAVPDRTDDGHKLESRILFPKFQLDLISVVLVDVKDNQLLRSVSRDLAAELAADRPTTSGDKNRLAGDKFIDLLHVRPDRIPPKEIFH